MMPYRCYVEPDRAESFCCKDRLTGRFVTVQRRRLIANAEFWWKYLEAHECILLHSNPLLIFWKVCHLSSEQGYNVGSIVHVRELCAKFIAKPNLDCWSKRLQNYLLLRLEQSVAFSRGCPLLMYSSLQLPLFLWTGLHLPILLMPPCSPPRPLPRTLPFWAAHSTHPSASYIPAVLPSTPALCAIAIAINQPR